MAYLTKEEFTERTLMPTSDVNALEAKEPGHIDALLEGWSRWIDARLRKRYAVPFEAPYPETVKEWLARLVTLRAYFKLGVDVNDEQYPSVQNDHNEAKEEIKEAANAVDGLFDLPLAPAVQTSGIVRGGPLVYSEASPYVAFDDQLAVGVAEDRARRGTSSG